VMSFGLILIIFQLCCTTGLDSHGECQLRLGLPIGAPGEASQWRKAWSNERTAQGSFRPTQIIVWARGSSTGASCTSGHISIRPRRTVRQSLRKVCTILLPLLEFSTIRPLVSLDEDHLLIIECVYYVRDIEALWRTFVAQQDSFAVSKVDLVKIMSVIKDSIGGKYV
jgi:hypothetical protein